MEYHSIIKVAEVLIRVRQCGLTVSYSPKYQEFRIDYKKHDPRWTEDSAYYTTYRDDAIETARVMAKR